MKHYKKALAVLFALTWLFLFIIVGAAEQGTISFGTAMLGCAVNYIIMGLSGFGSGLLIDPADKKGENNMKEGDDSE